MSESNSPTHEQITQRAYEIFVERGRPQNCDLDHWLEAEAQLRAAGKTNGAPQIASTETRASHGNGRSHSAPRASARARK